MAERRRRGLIGLLTANGISALGTRMSMLAIPWFVLTTTGSAAETGIVAFAETAPYVLLMAFGGPWVDRIGAWRVAVASELLAGVAIGLIPLLHFSGALTLPLLAGLAGFAGAVRGAGDTGNRVLVPALADEARMPMERASGLFDGISRVAGLAGFAGAVRGAGDTGNRVLVPALADEARMPMERASGLFDGISRVAGMVGVPVAGILIAATSAPVVIVIDAVTFFASGLLMLALVPRSSQPAAHPDEADSGYLRRLAQGFGHLRGDRLLLGIGFMVLVTNLVDAAAASVLLPLWGSERLGSPVGIGLMSGAFGLGAVSGNATLTWLGPRLSRRNVYAVGFLVAGAPRLAALAVAHTVEPMLVVMFVSGFGAGSINPILGAVEFERVPRHLQARVIGAIGALAWAGIPLGPIIGGAGAELIGLAATLWLAAGVYLVVTLVPFVFPVWREMDRRAPVPQVGAEPPRAA